MVGMVFLWLLGRTLAKIGWAQDGDGGMSSPLTMLGIYYFETSRNYRYGDNHVCRR